MIILIIFHVTFSVNLLSYKLARIKCNNVNKVKFMKYPKLKIMNS